MPLCSIPPPCGEVAARSAAGGVFDTNSNPHPCPLPTRGRGTLWHRRVLPDWYLRSSRLFTGCARNELRPARELARLVEVAVGADRRTHQEPIAFLDDPLGVAGLHVGMADDHVRLLANADDLGHRLQHHLVLVLARIAELLAQVALADEHGADARHLLQHIAQ